MQGLICAGVKEEGIFRKAGAAARIKMLRQKCEDLKGDVNFEALGALPHDVSALVKSFVRLVGLYPCSSLYPYRHCT
jgi:hypothetical protein